MLHASWSLLFMRRRTHQWSTLMLRLAHWHARDLLSSFLITPMITTCPFARELLLGRPTGTDWLQHRNHAHSPDQAYMSTQLFSRSMLTLSLCLPSCRPLSDPNLSPWSCSPSGVTTCLRFRYSWAFRRAGPERIFVWASALWEGPGMKMGSICASWYISSRKIGQFLSSSSRAWKQLHMEFTILVQWGKDVINL